MTKRTTRWLLCLVLVVALVASLSLVACDKTATATFVGGDGATGNAPEPITANVGEKINLPSNTFTYANHNFAGWSDGTTVYQAGAEYTLVADVTFTAQWTQAGPDATKYSLKFALGEHAAEGATVPATQQLAEGATYTLPAGPDAEDGWEFNGWSDGTTVYQAGATYTMPASEKTLTAQWKQTGSAVTEYTLKYELGEHAAEGATVPATQQLAKGATYTLPDRPDAEDGWIFEIWVDNNGNYAPAGSQKEMPAGDVTYTAQYTEDGSGEDEPFTTEPFDGAIVDLDGQFVVIFTTYQQGEVYSLKIQPISGELNIAGDYDYIVEEGKILVFLEDEPVGAGSIEGTLVYIALEVGDDAVEIMGEMAKLTITGSPEFQGDFYLNVGAPIYTLLSVMDYNLESVSFNGTPLDLSAEEAAVAAGEGYTEMPETDSTLALTIAEEEQGLDFADFEGIWSCGETFELLSTYDLLKVSEDGTISFHEVGYDYSGDLYSTGTSVVDGKTVVSFSQGAWTITLTLNSLEEFTMHAENSIFSTSFDKTFHKAQQVTATFELGECPDGVAPSPQQVYPGNSIYEPTKPEWDKHAFTGWFVDDQKVTFPYTINEDTTFVAHWEERSTVTVTFEANGDGVSNLPDTQTFDYGGHATRPAQQPTRDGYEFKGWGISSDSTTYFDFDGTEVKDNLTLYAIWAKRVTVTFSVDGHTDKIDAKQGVAGEPIDLPECTYEKDGWTFLGWKREGYEDLISGTTVTVQGDVTIVAVFQQTFQVDEGGRYTKVVVRDDGYVELFYSESYSSRYSYTYDDGTGLYTVTTYSSQIIFKTENGKAVFSDGYEGTHTSKDEKATLTLDGFGKATFKAASDPVQGTYTVKSTSAEEETATVGFTFDSDVFELTAVSQYGYFMGFSGLATVGGEKYIFGDYVYNITVTLSINDQTETVEVEYGTLFTYDGIESKAPQGKLFYAWLKDGEVFDISSTPITEEITLTAKFRVAATFDYLDGTDATVIWDEDDDGSLEVTFPDADDHTYVGGTFGGWNDKADEAEPKTLHAVGSTVTITATTHYVAVWNESTEAPFTTELFNAAIMFPSEDIYGYVQLYSEVQDGSSGVIGLAGGVGMGDYGISGGFTYSIATDGTITVADFDGSFGLKFVSGSLHGHTLRMVFSFTTAGNTTQYTFAGNLVQITLKNYSNKGTDLIVYLAGGTQFDITSFTYDENHNYPLYYKVGGVQSDAEDFGSYIVPAEDTEIECVWEGEVTPPTGKPFTTEPFNAFLMYTRDDDTILLLQLAEEYSYVQIISEMFDGGYTEYYFEYTISADGKITVVGHDDINEDCGITFVSGTLQGRKLVFVFKNESDSQNYTFEVDLVAITFQNSDKAGNDVVVYLEEGSNLSELIVNGYCNDSDRKHPLSYNILGQSYTSETISDYTLNSDVTVVCVWEGGSVSTSFTVTYQPGESATGSEYVDEVDSADYSFLSPFDSEKTNYSRAGYHFKGWKIEGDESGTLYQRGNAYTLTQSIVVTAQWEKDFAISFAGVEGADTNFDRENVKHTTSSTSRYFLPKESIAFLETGVWFSKSGYTLKGWTSSDDDGTDNAGKVYAPGSEYTLTKDVTFTAQWEKAFTSDHFAEYFGTYIPDETFQIQSGTEVSKIVVTANSIEIYDDSDDVVMAKDIAYNEDNITFVVDVISVKMTFEGNKMTLNYKSVFTEKTVTLTKQEEEVVDKHKVMYECGEHGAELDLPQAEQYAEGAQVTVGYGLGNVEESGLHYEFTGWSDGNHTYVPGDTFDMGSEDVTLTAQWAEYTPTDKTLNDYLGTWEGKAFTERKITKITIRSDEDVTYVTSDYPDSELELSNITVNAEGKYFVLTVDKETYGRVSWTLVITFTSDTTATLTINGESAEFKRTSTLEPAQPKPDKPEDADGIYVNAAGTKALDEQIDGEYASGSYDFTRVELNGDSINLISTSPINDIALTWNHNEATGRYYIYKFTVVATEGQLEITFNYGQQDFKATFTKAQMVSVTATFEKGEDDGVMGEPPVAITQQVVEGDQASVKMPDAGTLSREGFTFDGWQIKGDPEKHVYKKGETVKISGDQTFVPVWKENTAGGDSELPSTFSELAGRSFGFESAEAAGDNTITFTERIVIYKAEFVWYKPFGGSYAWYLQCYYSTTKTQYKLSDVVEGTAIDTEDAAYTAVNFTVSGNKWKVELTAEDGVLSLSITSSESVTTTWAEIVA